MTRLLLPAAVGCGLVFVILLVLQAVSPADPFLSIALPIGIGEAF